MSLTDVLKELVISPSSNLNGIKTKLQAYRVKQHPEEFQQVEVKIFEMDAINTTDENKTPNRGTLRKNVTGCWLHTPSSDSNEDEIQTPNEMTFLNTQKLFRAATPVKTLYEHTVPSTKKYENFSFPDGFYGLDNNAGFSECIKSQQRSLFTTKQSSLIKNPHCFVENCGLDTLSTKETSFQESQPTSHTFSDHYAAPWNFPLDGNLFQESSPNTNHYGYSTKRQSPVSATCSQVSSPKYNGSGHFRALRNFPITELELQSFLRSNKREKEKRTRLSKMAIEGEGSLIPAMLPETILRPKTRNKQLELRQTEERNQRLSNTNRGLNFSTSVNCEYQEVNIWRFIRLGHEMSRNSTLNAIPEDNSDLNDVGKSQNDL